VLGTYTGTCVSWTLENSLCESKLTVAYQINHGITKYMVFCVVNSALFLVCFNNDIKALKITLNIGSLQVTNNAFISFFISCSLQSTLASYCTVQRFQRHYILTRSQQD